jgi:hypothetical protein
MNKRLFAEVSNLTSADIATLISGVLNSGRVKINANSSFTVDGISLSPVMPVSEKKKVANKIQFNGKTWTLEFDGTVVNESDMVGLHYIRQLIQRPHKEIHVSDLVTGAYGEPVEIMEAKNLFESGVAVSDEEMDEITGNVDLQVITTEFADEILPDENCAFVFGLLEKEYKYLAKLERKESSCEVLKQKEKIKEDIKEIKKYLEVHRYRGKNVCFETRADKDRKSVAKAIKEAIARIAKKNPSLAEHLRKSIKTGVYCYYRPETDARWEVAIKWRPVSSK